MLTRILKTNQTVVDQICILPETDPYCWISCAIFSKSSKLPESESKVYLFHKLLVIEITSGNCYYVTMR